MTDGHNVGRLVVWPTNAEAIAAAADDGGERYRRMTIWPTYRAARGHKHHGGGGGGDLPDAPAGFAYLINGDDKYIVNGDDAFIIAEV